MPLLTLQEMQDRLDELEYKDWRLSIYDGAFEGYKLEVKATVDDSTNPGNPINLHVVSPITGFFSLEQFDYHIAKRLCIIETHECLENLKEKFTGRPLFNPHRPMGDQDRL